MLGALFVLVPLLGHDSRRTGDWAARRADPVRPVRRAGARPSSSAGYIPSPTTSMAGPRLVHTVTELISAFTVVNLCAIALFDVALPRIGATVIPFATDVLVGLAYFVSMGVCLVGAGLNPSSVLGTSAVVGGVLAICLQSTLGNILGGVALQIDGSIHVGRLDSARERAAGQGARDPLAPHRDRDAQLGHHHRPQLDAPRAVVLHPRPAHGDAAAAPHVGLLQRRLPLRAREVISAVNDVLQASPIRRRLEPRPHAICMDFAKDRARQLRVLRGPLLAHRPREGRPH